MNCLDIDYKATAKNVDHLLKDQLPHLVLRSGYSLIDLSSPKLSLAPAHSNRTDIQETQIVNSFSVTKVVDAIHKTIFHCSSLSRKILIDRYIKYFTQTKTVMSIPYERSYYFNVLLPKAQCEFADRYDYWQEQCHVDDDDIIDLHTYINNPSSNYKQ